MHPLCSLSKALSRRAPAFFPLATVLLTAAPCFAGWGPANKDYGGNLNMQLYTPSQVAASPAVLVAIHYCTGNANSPHGWFDSAADKNGFFIISPDAGKQCFDSSATRAGDRADIVKMVQYVITQKNADKTRVFAAGLSSGGCMTNTLLAIYPDVFAGGSAMPGFPAGGWPAGDTTCSKCGSTPPNNTAKQWGDLARNAFAFSGTRPCVQQWVGGADEYNFNGWLPAVASQFTDLMVLDRGSTGTGGPSGWTRTVYKDTAGKVRLETNLGPSTQKHDLSSAGLFGYVISFLGLDKPTGSCGSTTVAGGAGSGGGSSTGGATSTGGKGGAGGTSSSGSGGKATGGTSTGGVTNAGGTSSGGAIASTGGTPSATGGTSSATGGTPPATGGTSSATGGVTSATGGSAVASGGSPGTQTGGSGTVLSGGVTGAGGASMPTSGGATTGAAGSATGGSGSADPGCACSTAVGAEPNVGLGGLVGLALCAGWRARRRARRSRA